MAATYVNSAGQRATEGQGVYPIGTASDGRTIYSDGSRGWTQWSVAGYTGGGGGSNYGTSSNPTNASTNNGIAAPSPEGISQAEIDSAYNPQIDYLNQVEAKLNEDYPGIQKEIQGNYDVNSKILGSGRDTSKATLGLQESQGQTQRDTTIAQSRRLLGEQQMGLSARYGANSNVGIAGSELLNREQIRQTGDTQRQFAGFQQQIGQARQKIETDYNNGLLQLEQQKQSALSQAKRDFDAKMLEIANNRSQVESAKAQMRLQSLQDLRNKVYAIQVQNYQFQQALALQKQQSTQAVTDSATQFTNQVNQGQQGYNTLSNNYSGLPQTMSFNAGGNQPAPNQYIGQISNATLKKDELNNPLYT